VKYGSLLTSLFERPGGDSLRRRIDAMPNPEYQRLLRHAAPQVRDLLPGTGPDAAAIGELIGSVPDDALLKAVRNLGGHDLTALAGAMDHIDDSRPTVIIAYTIKGYGLPTEGHPQNHSALLTRDQLSELAARLGEDPVQPRQRLAESTEPGQLCLAAARRLDRDPVPVPAPVTVPPRPRAHPRAAPAPRRPRSAGPRCTTRSATRQPRQPMARIKSVSLARSTMSSRAPSSSASSAPGDAGMATPSRYSRACSTGEACGLTETRSPAESCSSHSAVMIDTMDALDAWWPPTLSPVGFGRTRLA
jgi:pyruvate dehydrogenase E1 component